MNLLSRNPLKRRQEIDAVVWLVVGILMTLALGLSPCAESAIPSLLAAFLLGILSKRVGRANRTYFYFIVVAQAICIFLFAASIDSLFKGRF